MHSEPILIGFEQYIKLVFGSYGAVDRYNFTKREYFDDPYAMQPELLELKKLLPMDDFDAAIEEVRSKLYLGLCL